MKLYDLSSGEQVDKQAYGRTVFMRLIECKHLTTTLKSKNHESIPGEKLRLSLNMHYLIEICYVDIGLTQTIYIQA